MERTTGVVTKKEYISYGAYFVGQNIFYFLIFSYMNIYFTDVGISALAVAAIALAVKIWDAVNDPIFGGIVDKVKFKKGVFLPWLKISLVGIPVTTVLLFAIPANNGSNKSYASVLHRGTEAVEQKMDAHFENGRSKISRFSDKINTMMDQLFQREDLGGFDYEG